MARYVIGLENVLSNIQREMMGVRGRTYKGMVAAMKFLENEMDTVNPVVPIDTKLMRDSWFISGSPHPTNPIVWAGYTAPYAPIVHENVGPVNWTRPGSGPKWLQIHWDRNQREMVAIVARHARISGSKSWFTAALNYLGSIGTGGLPDDDTPFVNIADRTNERNVEF